VYLAAYSHARSDGWRPYVRLRVRAGVLHEICFDAVRADGATLRASEGYLEQYRLDRGVDLVEYFDGQIDAVLEAQAERITASAAAVEWSVALYRLLAEVVPAARAGRTEDETGVILIPTEEPYLRGDGEDELGWRAELLVIYQADRVAAADYREVRAELDGSLRIKRADETYQQDYERLLGVRSAQAEAALLGALVDAGGPATLQSPDLPDELADAITGATLTAGRFIALAGETSEMRNGAALPDRLCR
jgi:major membrane immunogen (membrane-anchored lipoprotein)